MSLEARYSTGIEPRPVVGLARGVIALLVLLAPALGALVWCSEFITQDGPAHLYNARILNASLGDDSPFRETFEIIWSPLPNWAGHLGTMALVALFRPDVAGRLMAAITLVAFAAAIVWLRWMVSGSKGLKSASVVAAILALNVTWLLGFTSFLLGSALLPLTLGVWWGGREWFGPLRALGLAVLLVLGYFCHPISLGLTIVGLGLLAVLTPGVDRVARGLWTAASLAPLIPLGLAYVALTRSGGGGLAPAWQYLENPWSITSWTSQIGWVDPISLASRSCLPFVERSSQSYRALSPSLWAMVALGVLALMTWRARSSDRRGWLVLAVLLILGGLVGPDTLGLKHGHYMPQRLALLGLVALVPWLDFEANRRVGRAALGLLLVVLAVQSAFVWEYALDCRKLVAELDRARTSIGDHQRVGTLMVGIKRRYRSNPLLHADCLFGLESDNVVWNNYETSHYYFPVKVRPGLNFPPALDFEQIVLLDADAEREEKTRRWNALLGEHAQSIDVILVWSEVAIPGLDEVNRANGYHESFRDGSVRVWARDQGIAARPRGTR
jgi:hypothetical protein